MYFCASAFLERIRDYFKCKNCAFFAFFGSIVFNGEASEKNVVLARFRKTYAGVNTDMQRKCTDAPSYLCALFLILETPEFWLPTTHVSLLRRHILGAYLRWPLGALPLIYALNM